jgi:transposase
MAAQVRIDTVAMESTGVYWKPLFGVLIKEGFEVTWSTLISS